MSTSLMSLIVGEPCYAGKWKLKYFHIGNGGVNFELERRPRQPRTPQDFNAEAYLSNNPDFQPHIRGNRISWAQSHYIDLGRQEGRCYLPLPQDFNAEAYLSNNSDFQPHIRGNRTFWAQNHYVNHGRNEGRCYLPLPQNFDPEAYLENYEDLRNAVRGNRTFWAQNHYVNHGEMERRNYR